MLPETKSRMNRLVNEQTGEPVVFFHGPEFRADADRPSPWTGPGLGRTGLGGAARNLGRTRAGADITDVTRQPLVKLSKALGELPHLMGRGILFGRERGRLEPAFPFPGRRLLRRAEPLAVRIGHIGGPERGVSERQRL